MLIEFRLSETNELCQARTLVVSLQDEDANHYAISRPQAQSLGQCKCEIQAGYQVVISKQKVLNCDNMDKREMSKNSYNYS